MVLLGHPEGKGKRIFKKRTGEVGCGFFDGGSSLNLHSDHSGSLLLPRTPDVGCHLTSDHPFRTYR